MKPRNPLLPILTGLLVSWIVGLLAGTDMVSMYVEEFLTRVVRTGFGDSNIWMFIDGFVVLILTTPGIIAGVALYAWRNRFGRRNR